MSEPSAPLKVLVADDHPLFREGLVRILRKLQPQARVLISDPSWENHRALFESAVKALVSA